MTDDQLKNKSKFKYNMSFYYQSTIIYFLVFAAYLIIRGQFIDNSYTLVTKDPIIYLLAILVVISLVSLIYNLFRNRHIEFDKNGNLYFAHYGSKAAYIFSMDGNLIQKTETPGLNPTNLEFGGKDLKTLYLIEVETNSLYTIKVTKPGYKK